MTRSIRTILVSLNKTPFFDGNMAMAKQIAREYNSHIIGLYVIPTAIVYTTPYGYGGPINLTELHRFYKSKASEIEDQFSEYIRKEGLNGEWRQTSSLGHFVSDAIIEHGREADLIILGDDSSTNTDVQFEGHIAKSTGRPVLLVPNTTRQDFSFKRAIVGWDGSREAARAAFDAVPLLQMSDTAEVTCFNAHIESQMSGDTPGSELAKSLARHNINAEAVNVKTKKSISTGIMECAEAADLLVIGAYGHSRLRENVFGGVTNKALSEMPCPVLLSS
jgi:nucleotide-binding universal stress UspA family protein